MLFFTMGVNTGMLVPKYLAATTSATIITEMRKIGKDGGVRYMWITRFLAME